MLLLRNAAGNKKREQDCKNADCPRSELRSNHKSVDLPRAVHRRADSPIPNSQSITGLLRQLDRQLPLRLRHFAPKLLEIGLHRHIFRIFSQCLGEPAIRSRQIARRAQPRRVQRAHLDHRFRIRLVGFGLEQLKSAIAALRRALSVQIFLRFRNRIARSCRLRHRRGLCRRRLRRLPSLRFGGLRRCGGRRSRIVRARVIAGVLRGFVRIRSFRFIAALCRSRIRRWRCCRVGCWNICCRRIRCRLQYLSSPLVRGPVPLADSQQAFAPDYYSETQEDWRWNLLGSDRLPQVYSPKNSATGIHYSSSAGSRIPAR